MQITGNGRSLHGTIVGRELQPCADQALALRPSPTDDIYLLSLIRAEGACRFEFMQEARGRAPSFLIGVIITRWNQGRAPESVEGCLSGRCECSAGSRAHQRSILLSSSATMLAARALDPLALRAHHPRQEHYGRRCGYAPAAA